MIEGLLCFLAGLSAVVYAVTFVRALQITVGCPDPYHRRFDLRAELERLENEQAERRRECSADS